MTPLEACTQLLVHFDSATGDFVDASPNRRKMVRVGPNNGASATAKFGGYAYENTSNAVRNCLLFGERQAPSSGPYSLEAWVRITAYPGGSNQACIISTGYSDFERPGLRITGTGLARLTETTGGNGVTHTTGTNVIPLNTWTHVAACRGADKVTRLFVNGVQEASTATVTAMDSGPGDSGTQLANLAVGGSGGSSGYSLVGQIDEVRYVVGIGVYTANFTPPVAAFADCPVFEGIFKPSAPLQLAAAAPPPTASRLTSSPILAADLYYGGTGRVQGTVKEKGTPANTPMRRRVRLIREREGRFVRETWSDATTGAYDFPYVDPTVKYTVLTYDYAGNYRAVVADNLTPEAMP